jgi:formylglycine-generating enzyme required for sulfatase activity
MKVLFVSVLALTLGLSSALQGQAVTTKLSGNCGVGGISDATVTWAVIDSAGVGDYSYEDDHHYTLLIEGTGMMYNYPSVVAVPWWNYILKIKYVRIGADISGIDCLIFKGPMLAEVFTYASAPPAWECNELSPVNMVRVTGGSYMMGGATGSGGNAFATAHTVTLDDFYIGKYEVTEQQWNEVMTPSSPSTSTYPQVGISRNQIVGTTGDVVYTVNAVEYRTDGFCGKMYLATGIQWRLPSEAEWEYAARGGLSMNSLNSGTDYTYAGGNTASDVGWIANNSIQPVKTKPIANALGLYDMSGNVWECCSDWYDEAGNNAYSTAVAEQTFNPVGAMTGVYRVLRGGAYFNAASDVRVLYRIYTEPMILYASHGFRLACSSPPTPNP